MISNIPPTSLINLIGRAEPPPVPKAQKYFPNLHKFPELKRWVDLQTKPDKTAEDLKSEFDIIRQFCAANKIPAEIILPTGEKIKIYHSKPAPGLSQIPEKFIIYKSKPVIHEKKIKGQTVKQTQFVPDSSITYEFYPDNTKQPDAFNCRIVKLYVKELYKKDPRTGLYVQEKDPATGMAKVDDVENKTIEVKNGKAALIDEGAEQDAEEDAILDKVYPEDSKALQKRRAKSAIKKTKTSFDKTKAKKTDPLVKCYGWTMRSSMALKLKKLEKKINGMGYKMQITSTMGGQHSAWAHRNGYAVDFAIYREVNKKRVYLNEYSQADLKSSEKFEKEMNKLKTGLFIYNEYVHRSTYWTGGHFHVAINNPTAMAQELQLAMEELEPGSKATMTPRELAEEAVYGTLIINGYNPADMDKETLEEMIRETEQTLKNK